MYMYCIDHPHKSHSMAHASNSEVIYLDTWKFQILCNLGFKPTLLDRRRQTDKA